MSIDPVNLPINAPSLSKGGGAIQGPGMAWQDVGTRGASTLEVALPISPARGYAPALSLNYHSAAGNGPFGIGWSLPLPVISRRTSHGVPTYTEQDEFIGADGQPLLPERNADGALVSRLHTTVNPLPLHTSYKVVRYFPRVESNFDRIEYWQPTTDTPGFWRVLAADGTHHLYGKTALARTANPDQPAHVAQWWLQESLSPHGEHIYYQYRAETDTTRYPRDGRARCYLERICYGNPTARKQEQLYLWQTDAPPPVQWHFQLLFDYGERTLALDQVPTYAPVQPWPSRDDPCSEFNFGFELRTLRLCRQVLMFHHFPDETHMGTQPVLVKRLLLEYRTFSGVNLLSGIHEQAYDSAEQRVDRPPLEYFYQSGKLKLDPDRYRTFSDWPGLDDGHRYQLVDLYGEGLPGCLYRHDQSWYYREPLRAQQAPTGDEITHGAPVALPRVPVADSNLPIHQALADVDGDGRPDWRVAQPGMQGFFSLDPQGKWSAFRPFNAFPLEFFHRAGVFADLSGAGSPDFAMIGPRSVRLYTSRQARGFAAAVEVPHAHDDILPVISSRPDELVAFSDVLATGQQHLVRIRHNEVKCWANLGKGRFGKGFVMATLPFDDRRFKAADVRLADLNGNGATDLLYLTPDALWIFLNKSGNRFDTTPLQLAWPDGVRHDDHCQVNLVDVQGLGCPSLIFSAPHQARAHWRYDFFDKKPGLLVRTHNNMGARTTLSYRSSAQEWLDEKRELRATGHAAVSRLPFVLHVVSRRIQQDEVSGNRFTQHLRYRHAYFDRRDREFRGFGLLLRTDRENHVEDAGPSTLHKTWFHTGQSAARPQPGYSVHDPEAVALGPTLLSRYQASDPGSPLGHQDPAIADPTPSLRHEAERALSGRVRRVEIMAADSGTQAPPYLIEEYRYRVRELAPSSAHTPHARLLPLPLESIRYRYEGVADDPVCEHQIHLRRDTYGCLTHGVTVHYARRKNANDPPPAVLANEHQQGWWRDTHDSAQQHYYLNETLSQPIHLTSPHARRLNLAYRQRDNTLVLEKTALRLERISFEGFINNAAGPLAAGATRELSNLWVQHYREAGGHGRTLETGVATVQALVDYRETAELDARALKAYTAIPATPGQATVELTQKLKDSGYKVMPLFFLFEGEAQQNLWAVRRHLPSYGNPRQFYRLKALRETRSHDETLISYDPYWLMVSAVKTPDGCLTQAEYDYRLLLPKKTIDPNGVVQEVRYDGFGQVCASTFYGPDSGFSTMRDHVCPAVTLAYAVDNPRSVLQRIASVHCYDPFSWMGMIDKQHVRQPWISRGYLLPSGHIRTSARLYMAMHLHRLTEEEQQLKTLIDQARQTPVHGLSLRADRYPGEPEQQIGLHLTYWDGFGRTLQTQHKTEPGLAHALDEMGNLHVEASGTDRKYLSRVIADSRWRVSERREYDNKGQAIRIYRPYFVNRHGYVNDQCLRELGISDRHFYDALGRMTRTLTAAGFMRRITYWAWYRVDEDENDTLDEASTD
ncbi:SpvB/TcaC N-terminal domain-containing protein [Pseudomonas poae]|uniref:Toxin n=1 Tax=Pseudomonas poae TaxID=200451 RepID=A0A2S9EZY1_9PSED|nr:SpvB/TcaC N-terminal domain-containing protein [Pseudomonas poae]PRA31427.1 toxin [Pseudomonas poae]PRC23033.1 toxin [Pseudomonas poae]